jgi:hypothetical protein
MSNATSDMKDSGLVEISLMLANRKRTKQPPGNQQHRSQPSAAARGIADLLRATFERHEAEVIAAVERQQLARASLCEYAAGLELAMQRVLQAHVSAGKSKRA